MVSSMEELTTAGASAAARLLNEAAGTAAAQPPQQKAQIWATETCSQRMNAPKDRHQVLKVLPKTGRTEPEAPKAPLRTNGANGPVRIT